MNINHTLRDRLRTAYDQQATVRDGMESPPWKTNLRAGFLDRLQREKRRTLLEIGSGAGKDALFFQEHGLQVVCADLSPELVRICRSKGLDAREMDAAALDFPPASFDALYAFNSLLHIPDAELPAVLKLAADTLKPEGIAFIGMYGGRDQEGIWEEDWYTPKRFFAFRSDAKMRDLLEACFTVLTFESLEVGDPGVFPFQAFVLRKKEF